jgi:hypothetical protein
MTVHIKVEKTPPSTHPPKQKEQINKNKKNNDKKNGLMLRWQ